MIDAPRERFNPTTRAVLVLGFLLIFGIVFSWPLWPERATRVAGDPGDPVFVASMLKWSATTLPLTERWWNPPYFYPTQGVTAFSESFIGISALASPIYWITGNALTTYNLCVLLSWSFSGFAMYLLVRFLTKREDAAILAGLAFGFSPYRTYKMGHLQMTSSYWIPFVFLGLHGYLSERRRWWLALFAVAWILQSLANLYMLLFTGVLIGLWLVYFCSTRKTWRAGLAVGLTWGVASLPLVPILLRYREIHQYFGLARALDVLVAFSLPPDGFLQVSSLIVLWRHVLPDGQNLFPGLVPPAVVAVALAVRARQAGTPWPVWKWSMAFLLVASSAVAAVTIAVGPWERLVAGIWMSAHEITRPLIVACVCGGTLALSSRWVRGAVVRRDVWAFYTLGVIVMGLSAYGPVVRLGHFTVLEHGPYWWLMKLPGFTELRVPFRIWMLGVLCLCVSLGYAFASFRLRSAVLTKALLVALMCALSVDVWARITMAPAPEIWPDVEPAGRSEPIIEIPLGPAFDAAATYRSIAHGRPVVNGVSGYDPPHYAPLQDGLNDFDPGVLYALATFGTIDVVVNRDDDPRGVWEDYVAHVPGIVQVSARGPRALYRLPTSSKMVGALGPRLPIRAVEAYNGNADGMTDGRLDTVWQMLPQSDAQWVIADLGDVHVVGGIAHGLGSRARDFPRHLAIDVSIDGQHWEQVFDDRMAGWAVRASIVSPMQAVMQIPFTPREARYVRLRELAIHKNFWVIAELEVHGPSGR